MQYLTYAMYWSQNTLQHLAIHMSKAVEVTEPEKQTNLWNRSPLIIETRVTEYNHTAWRRHYYLKWDIKTLTSLTCVHFEYISKKHFFIDLTDYVLWSHLTHIISVIFVNLITHLTNIYGYLSVLVILEWQCKKNAINQFMNDW